MALLMSVGFFWISTLSKVSFGELSMRVGAHWNWHDEQFCLDAKKQKDPTVSEQAKVTKKQKIKSMPQKFIFGILLLPASKLPASRISFNQSQTAVQPFCKSLAAYK